MKRNGLISERQMVDKLGNEHVVQEFAAVVNHRDLSGEIAGTTESRILRTTTGLHVNYDGLSYSLPQRGNILLIPKGDTNE